jgi:hypothetical protein
VTVAESIDISTSELSPEMEVSPVTLPNNVVADVEQNEVSEEVEEATPLEQMDATSVDESEEAITHASGERKVRVSLPQKLSIEEADSTAVEDAIASQPEGTWVWNKETGECLGQVLRDGGNRLKIRRTGEPASRAKWHTRNQITFQNPTVSALSLNTPPTTPVEWEDSEQFLEEFED